MCPVCLASAATLVGSVVPTGGVGALLVTSILTKDYPVVQALILFTTAAYVFANVLVDGLYGVLDPRVRYR